MTKLIYFAWVRERIGKREEEVELPADVKTVADLLTWLQAQGRGIWRRCGSPKSSASPSTRSMSIIARRLSGAREIALFPPMTGG